MWLYKTLLEYRIMREATFGSDRLVAYLYEVGTKDPEHPDYPLGPLFSFTIIKESDIPYLNDIWPPAKNSEISSRGIMDIPVKSVEEGTDIARSLGIMEFRGTIITGGDIETAEFDYPIHKRLDVIAALERYAESLGQEA
jgi:hypothetical protein